MKHTLKSTNQRIHPVEYSGQGIAPYPANYERVLILNQYGKNHIQIVRNDNIKRTPTTFDEVA